MSAIIFEALMEFDFESIDVDPIGTPDLETLAEFIASYAVKKGFIMTDN